MSLTRLSVLGLVVQVMVSATTANATPIIVPQSAVINEGAPGFGEIADTFNQNGLLAGYVPGVTDFDAYLATNPLHSLLFPDYEWFSNAGRSTAVVTYDFGTAAVIDRLALWNEESAGIGRLSVSISLDNLVFLALLSAITPPDRPVADYGAEVYAFDAVTTRYVRFEMSGCPQQIPGNFPACAIGEIAFRGQLVQQQVTDVPEPSSLLLFGTALLIVATLAKRRRPRKGTPSKT